MAFTEQNQQGTVDNANSYASVVVMKAFHADRGTVLTPYSDERLSQALVRATDFLDSRYSFIGEPLRSEQGTQCPRILNGPGASYPYETAHRLTGLQWVRLIQACCMLAYRDLTLPAGLMPDPTFDATGQKVSKKTVKAGPIEKTVEYAPSTAPDANVPSYPAIDLLLKTAGLLNSRSGGTLTRA